MHESIIKNNSQDGVLSVKISRLKDEMKLLGNNYRKGKAAYIDPSKHLILKSAHPSPLSAYRGFFGNKHFSRANDYLVQNGIAPIKW